MAYIGKEPASGIRNRFIFTATAGQTTFSGTDDHNRTLSYTDAEFTDVFLNGIKLDKSDYTATSGTSIVLDEAAAVDDIIEVIAFDTFSVFSGEFSQDVTVGGNVSVTGDLTVGTSQSLFWDASAESLGIGTTSPDRAIKIHKDNAYVWIADAAGGNVAFMGGSGQNDGLFRLYEGGGHTAKVEIHSDADSYFNGGNVGIGTSSPAHELTVQNSTSDPAIRVHADTTSSPAPSIELMRGTDDTFGSDNYSDYRIKSTSGHLTFEHGANGSIDERMRIDNSGNVLVGKSATDSTTAGVDLRPEGVGVFVRDGNRPLIVNRLTSDGDLIAFRKNGTTVGSISTYGDGVVFGNAFSSAYANLRYTNNEVFPCRTTGGSNDNAIDLGKSSARFDDVYATNGSIQTSDANEKQQIASLTDAEIAAAKTISSLFKTFKWNDKVEAKGDAARTHTGVIAQDVQQAMTDAGLDVGDYAFFISDTWWETQTEVPAVEADEENGIEAADAYTRTDTYDTAEEAPEGATERTRLGIRYPELLAFVGAATEQRLASIETRLTALEAN